MTVADLEFRALLQEAQAANDRGQTKQAISKLWRAATLAAYDNDEKALESVLRLAAPGFSDKGVGVREDTRALSAYCEICLEEIRSGVAKRKRTLADLFSISRKGR